VNGAFNHLWQSTIFAVAVAAVAALLQRQSPRLRYWLWLAASVKFLIPFSLLVTTGARVQLPPDTPSLHATTVQQISTYFSPAYATVPARTDFPWMTLLSAIWIAGTLLLLIRWRHRWCTIRGTARRARKSDLLFPAPVFVSAAAIEPGIFGILRPVLLLPENLRDELTAEQFDAILAHESRHIQFRDNLTAALHMLVEAVFWFHPLVWWIGARLTDERERDCDEAALRQGSRPADYARGIVSVCQNYAESPLLCASGISGADLKKRIREIMAWRGSLPVSRNHKALIAGAALATVAVPFAIGILRAQTLPPAPRYGYGAVSIHKSDPNERNIRVSDGPQGGIRTLNTTPTKMIAFAYNVEDYQVIGAPAWASSESFDVTLTPDAAEKTPDSQAGPQAWQEFWNRNRERMEAVLHDRFGLVVRIESRELPIYRLTEARSGNKLVRHTDASKRLNISTNDNRQIRATDATMDMLAAQLSMDFHRPVRNETHIEGEYDFTVDWVPDPELPEGPVIEALNNKLGLRVESSKGPVPVYVVEKINRPTEN